MIIKERKWNCCKSIIVVNNWFLQKVCYDIENAPSKEAYFLWLIICRRNIARCGEKSEQRPEARQAG
jgi:hypothetical protein